LSPSVDVRLKKLQGSGGLWASANTKLPENNQTIQPITMAKSGKAICQK
jgi:hypothetical protein